MNPVDTRRWYEQQAAEAAFLEAKGAAGEQPEELPCRCPRACWCQNDGIREAS